MQRLRRKDLRPKKEVKASTLLSDQAIARAERQVAKADRRLDQRWRSARAHHELPAHAGQSCSGLMRPTQLISPHLSIASGRGWLSRPVC